MKNRKPSNLLCCYFLCIVSLSISLAIGQNTSSSIPVNVGVVLDDLDSPTGKLWLSCINMALSDFYTSNTFTKTRLVLSIRDSRSDVVLAAAAALDLIKNVQVQAIIGPKSTMQANFIIDLGDKAHVPIISFSATSSSLTSLKSPYFFRAAQNDSRQVQAISDIIQAFGWRQAVPIYVDNEFGQGILPSLADALQKVQVRIPYQSAISPTATGEELSSELYKLMTMQTRVFIVHMSPSLGPRFFAKVQELEMMNEGYVWILTDGLTNHLSSMNASVTNSMHGALGVRTYVPETKELIDFRVRWKRQFQQENPSIIDAELDVMALWAYDAAFAVAMAVEHVGSKIFGFQNTNASINSSTDLETFGVSQNGQELRQSLSDIRFTGLAGNFSFDNGQLQSSMFQIVNVNDEGARQIGFWTPQSRLVKNLKSINKNTKDSTSTSNMGPIIWPGDSYSVPKGWEIPTNGKRLRVGVPIDAFKEFVLVVPDNSTNTTDVTGFCIDIFNAAMEDLPYAVTYDFIPFAYPNGTSAGSYSDLVQQVFLGNFDALAADTTIRSNRSMYVDFTLPYTDSGVVMVVPLKDGKNGKTWIFLKPLTLDLWFTSLCFFVFTAFVVWVLEHRINEDFRGPPLHQVGTSFWYSFSTMVFAHKERLMSNLARFVVIVWVFVMLILTQSYTASLSSLLTVQQLQPTFTNLRDLNNSGENVGCLEGSFVFDLLLQQGFNRSKIIPYRSPQHCAELLRNGSEKLQGGIAAAIDETPYMKLFLAMYCSNYTMVGPIFKTDGLGFVFPIGSPLVPDISRAILRLSEGDEMKKIENKWFVKQSSCSDTKPTVSDSTRLDLKSFFGLFLIVGVTSLLALIIFAASFFYRHGHIFMTRGASVWGRIKVFFRVFDQKDLSSHTFRKKEQGLLEASPSGSSYRGSPTVHSNRTDPGQLSVREQGTTVGPESPTGVVPAANEFDHPNPEIPSTPQGAQENN